jgi:phosphoglycerol transferase MdoB-like AlkP superfamily enzyme
MDSSAGKPEYSHTQKALLCLLVYALAAVFVALGWFVQDAPIPWLFPPIGLLMLVVAASFHHLKVEDHQSGFNA